MKQNKVMPSRPSLVKKDPSFGNLGRRKSSVNPYKRMSQLPPPGRRNTALFEQYKKEVKEDPEAHEKNKAEAKSSRSHKPRPSETVGPSLRTVLPQMINEQQNRKTYGTWNRQFDFTRTIIGYLLGIHNFFRFPYLCYKFGGVFFIAYITMMILVGIPVVFMEFTIGQYYGVGSYIAFAQMAPILNFVSKMLSWSCVLNAWMSSVIIGWLRMYSSGATSCLKGWEVCNPTFFYSSPHCWTGTLDDECNDPRLGAMHQMDENFVMENDLLFYNYRCLTITQYCKLHGWHSVSGTKLCQDSDGQNHTIYEKRYHATQEFLYGFVLGLTRNMDKLRKEHLITETLAVGNYTDIDDLRNYLFQSDFRATFRSKPSASETVRVYLKKLMGDPNMSVTYNTIMDNVIKPQRQEAYWDSHGRQLRINEESSSEDMLTRLSLTTWVIIAVFLFEGLLTVSFLSYVLNALPFCILVFVTTIAVEFKHASYGVEWLLRSRKSFAQDLINLDMWAEAAVQVIYTSGVGTGVLISLATYNNFEHAYLFDLYFTLGCSVITSCCGSLICFCSLAQYLKLHDIEVPFREYIRSESSTSSVEFSFQAYSHFLTLITERHVITIWFFFMVNSFSTDNVVRLVQNVLDALTALVPCLRKYPTLVLLALCFIGYITNILVLKNGSIVLFIDFEYFTMRYIIPTLLIIQIGAIVFVYKAWRLVDHAEQMCVFSSSLFRYYMLTSMYLSFFIMLATLLVNIITYKNRAQRFNEEEEERYTAFFSWVFCGSPLIMSFLAVIEQLILVPRERWTWLFLPYQGKDRKVRRAFLRRLQGRPDDKVGDDQDDKEHLREATAKWRTLESRLIITMMERRREEQQRRKQEAKNRRSQEAHDDKHDKNDKNEQVEAVTDAKPAKSPIFLSLVKAAAAARKANEGPVKINDVLIQEQMENENPDRMRRKAFLHASKNTWFSRVKAAFIGKASATGTYIPRRHVGGIGHSRIVTKISGEGVHTMHFDHEDDQASQDSMSHDDDIEAEEQAKLKYLNMMDYIERWPGRLDESDINSNSATSEDEEQKKDKVP